MNVILPVGRVFNLRVGRRVECRCWSWRIEVRGGGERGGVGRADVLGSEGFLCVYRILMYIDI